MSTLTFRDRKVRSKGRRAFLISAGLLSGGLAIGVYKFYAPRDRLAAPAALHARNGDSILTAWIKLSSDGRVTVQVPRQEMGQGIASTLAILVAEEMDSDPNLLGFEQAPVDGVYGNATMLGDAVPFRPEDSGWVADLARLTQFRLGELLGAQATGGSTSVRDAWGPMRHAGAAARAMLVSAAAQRFGVPAGACEVRDGIVTHAASGKRAGYGELAAEAAKLPIPHGARPKDPRNYRLLGITQPRLDVPAKVDGSAQFGIDVRLPGMRFAAIAQCPTFGGALAEFDAANAKARRGVFDVFGIEATSTSHAAVVVVAEHYWQAKTALAEITVRWNEGPNARHDTSAQRARYQALLSNGFARIYDEAGDPAAKLASASRRIEAEYFAPYLAHATMEPMNCTALLRKDGRCEVWLGNQAPTLAKWFAARAAGIDSAQVRVNTPYLGGGFGRRVEMDVLTQAVLIAKRTPDVPVQLIWSREEDMTHDVYRPMAMARFRAGFDAAGTLAAWDNRIVGQSCTGNLTARLIPLAASDAMKDKTTVEGAFDLPYALPNRRIEHVLTHEPVPVGYWRSVGHSYNAFFTECFIDECAAAVRRDPVAFRRTLLKDAPRFRTVLDTVAAKSGWGTPLPAGVARGVAIAGSFRSIVAQVAEVSITDGSPRVRRIVCAVDCGFALNPGIVAAQMESAIAFGLSAALYGEISLKAGRVEQTNFPAYDVVRMAQMPAIEVHIVQSGIEHLGGIGEPGTPPVAPAVCNAIYALTGKRVRSLPIRL